MDPFPIHNMNELETLRQRLAERDRDVARAENEIKRQEARVENARRWSEERELEFQQLHRENASLRETNAAQLRAINLAREIISGQESTRRQMLTIEKLLEGKQIDMAAVRQAGQSFKNAPNATPSVKHRQKAQGNQESAPR
jgi:hypothetical protein